MAVVAQLQVQHLPNMAFVEQFEGKGSREGTRRRCNGADCALRGGLRWGRPRKRRFGGDPRQTKQDNAGTAERMQPLARLDQLGGLYAQGGGDLVDAGRVDAPAALSFGDGVLGIPSFCREPFDGPDPLIPQSL